MLACRSLRWTGSLDGAQPELVGVADDLAALDAAAGHPDREAVRIVVAPFRAVRAAVRCRAAAEFAAPDHQRGIEQAAGFQVRQQPGDGLVGLGRARLVVLVACDVAVPVVGIHAVAVPHLHEANAALHQPPRQQAAAAEIRAHRHRPARRASSWLPIRSLTSVASGADICMRNASS